MKIQRGDFGHNLSIVQCKVCCKYLRHVVLYLLISALMHLALLSRPFVGSQLEHVVNNRSLTIFEPLEKHYDNRLYFEFSWP